MSRRPIPPHLPPCGIGLRTPHVAEIIATRPEIGFLEIHSENYFGGGIKLTHLESLRQSYDLSFHGVGLSLGRADALCMAHLKNLKTLIDRYQPILVSEHLSWSAYAHQAVPDLLPLPFTHEALGIFCDHVDQFQSHIGRTIVIENPSNYLAFDHMDMSEPEFLTAIAQRTGCSLLLDINNIYVSAKNLGRDPKAYLDAFSPDAPIAQYHLAGHDKAPKDLTSRDGQSLLIDTHGKPVCKEVWALYDYALARFGPRPSLIEWDTDVPDLHVLLSEARSADTHMRANTEAVHVS